MVHHTEIVAKQLGKKFGSEWLFRGFSCQFAPAQCYVVTGSNGSGKSTLLKILCGMAQASEGEVAYLRGKAMMPIDFSFRRLSFAAPYMDLPDEMTLAELVRFHNSLRPLSISLDAFFEQLDLPRAMHKPIQFFSSGMRQKLKLALALYTQSEILLLDEPTTNLDAANTAWYQAQLLLQVPQKTLIIASNIGEEYNFLPVYQTINIHDYKHSRS